MRPRSTLVALLLVLVAASTACSRDGRTLRQPGPNQTLTVKTAPTTTAPASTTVGASIGNAGLPTLSLVAPWEEGGGIPQRYTCKGLNASPALQWDGVPAEPVELALVMRDLDADGFIHWLMAGIDPASNGIGEAKIPRAAMIATNEFGNTSYRGPCPPAGEHRYLVTLFVLSKPSGITTGMSARDALALLEKSGARTTSVTGFFGV